MVTSNIPLLAAPGAKRKPARSASAAARSLKRSSKPQFWSVRRARWGSRSDHPVCAASLLAVGAYSLEASPCRARASRPPLRGGEWLLLALLWLLLPFSSFAGTSDVADAAMSKNTAAVRALIRQKANVNAPQADGTTALHWAARWDDLDMAAALI